MSTDNSITLIQWRGTTVRLFPPVEYYIYLLHFHSRYYHAGHYCGTTACLDARLQLHKHGRGAKLMKAITAAGIGFTVARLWKVETWEQARDLERKLKARHDGPSLCPICQHRPFDILVFMRQGHWPLSLFARPGKRQPITAYSPHFVRRMESEAQS